MTINLKEGERLDELQRNGYRIIQNPEKFCFGMDAVLLSGFAKVKAGERALDLGTGTGIIPDSAQRKDKRKRFHRSGDSGGKRRYGKAQRRA